LVVLKEYLLADELALILVIVTAENLDETSDFV